MAVCPNCKHKIPWYKFLCQGLFTVKQLITCRKCKMISKTKLWMIYTLLVYAFSLFLGGIFVWLADRYHFSVKILFVGWFLFLLFSPLLVIRAERELI
jgi:hypothetical protein